MAQDTARIKMAQDTAPGSFEEGNINFNLYNWRVNS